VYLESAMALYALKGSDVSVREWSLRVGVDSLGECIKANVACARIAELPISPVRRRAPAKCVV
jgi:hypothetical protein